MSPIIRISKKNWERLKHFAVPLEDSIDDALDRVLSTAESARGQSIQWKPDARQQPVNEIHETACKTEWEVENENRLLLQLEQWLNNLWPRVKLLHRKKTMATWILEKEGEQMKLFVPTSGLNKLYLPRTDYASIDKESRIVHKNLHDDRTGKAVGWNYYPQFDVKTPDDLEFAKRVINYLLEGERAQEGRPVSERPYAEVDSTVTKVGEKEQEGHPVSDKRESVLARLKERYEKVPRSLSLADELIRERRSEAYREQAG